MYIYCQQVLDKYRVSLLILASLITRQTSTTIILIQLDRYHTTLRSIVNFHLIFLQSINRLLMRKMIAIVKTS